VVELSAGAWIDDEVAVVVRRQAGYVHPIRPGHAHSHSIQFFDRDQFVKGYFSPHAIVPGESKTEVASSLRVVDSDEGNREISKVSTQQFLRARHGRQKQ
jgi:hypothetical protein